MKRMPLHLEADACQVYIPLSEIAKRGNSTMLIWHIAKVNNKSARDMLNILMNIYTIEEMTEACNELSEDLLGYSTPTRGES